MSISVIVEQFDGRDIVIFDVPTNFSREELMQKMQAGLNRANAKHSTFRAVIDYDYIIQTPSQDVDFYDRFSMLEKLNGGDYEYRIAIVIHRSAYFEHLRQGGLFSPLKGATDFFARVLFTADAFNTIDQKRNTGRNNWITVQDSREKAITWCVEESPWP